VFSRTFGRKVAVAQQEPLVADVRRNVEPDNSTTSSTNRISLIGETHVGEDDEAPRGSDGSGSLDTQLDPVVRILLAAHLGAMPLESPPDDRRAVIGAEAGSRDGTTLTTGQRRGRNQ